MSRTLHAALPILTLALLSSACSGTRFAVKRRVPAEVNIPAGKAIAVARISGNEGDSLVSELTQALVETQRFQVLERQHLAAAEQELRFSASGMVSDDSAISFGQMTGAATLVIGEVAEENYNENVTSSAGKCPRNGEMVDCTMHTRSAGAKLKVVLKVVETETGRLLAAKNFDAFQTRSATAYDVQPAEFAASGELFAQCRREVVQSFIGVVAPRNVDVWVVLETDSDVPELETGNNYAQVGNWSAAVDQYRAAVARTAAAEFTPAQRAAAYYNLGMGLGYSGDFDAGVTEIERAFATNPRRLYQEQVGALKQYKIEAARMAEQEPAQEPAQP